MPGKTRESSLSVDLGKEFAVNGLYGSHHIFFFDDNFWTRYSELEAFSAHVFDQDRQVQLAASGYLEFLRILALLDPQRDVVQQLALQPFLELA